MRIMIGLANRARRGDAGYYSLVRACSSQGCQTMISLSAGDGPCLRIVESCWFRGLLLMGPVVFEFAFIESLLFFYVETRSMHPVD
jgi:hypothetical protein